MTGTTLTCQRTERCTLPPDVAVEGARAGIVDNLTATQRDLRKPAGTPVTATTDDTRAAVALSGSDVARPTVRANVVAIARIASVVDAIMVHLHGTMHAD